MILNGTTYHDKTSGLVANILESYRTKRKQGIGIGYRLTLYYGGDGKLWGDDPATSSGYIGRSTGQTPIPLLIKNIRSAGGEAVLTDCIVGIRYARRIKGRVTWLYQHQDYKRLLDNLNSLHACGVKEETDEEAIACP